MGTPEMSLKTQKYLIEAKLLSEDRTINIPLYLEYRQLIVLPSHLVIVVYVSI